jgi:hypothetical protein
VKHVASSLIGVTHTFTDNTWVGPNFYIGDNNGWVDYRNAGTNQNTQANDLAGKELRLSYREGHYRFQQAWQRGLIVNGGLPSKWYPNANVSSGNDSFPGNFPGDAYWGRVSKAMMEHIEDVIDGGASNFLSQVNKVRTMQKGFTVKRKALQHSFTTSGTSWTSPLQAELLFVLAWYAMTFDDERDAGCVSIAGSTGVDAAQVFLAAFPAFMNHVWGQPTGARPTAAGQGGNGTNNNETDTWVREFTGVCMCANASSSTNRRVYPPLTAGVAKWKNQADNVPVTSAGLLLSPETGVMLIPV